MPMKTANSLSYACASVGARLAHQQGIIWCQARFYAQSAPKNLPTKKGHLSRDTPSNEINLVT